MNSRRPFKPNLHNVPKLSKLLLQGGSTEPIYSLAYRIPLLDKIQPCTIGIKANKMVDKIQPYTTGKILWRNWKIQSCWSLCCILFT